jgi:hypothetical protein
MEVFRIRAIRMAERADVTRQQEVERLQLLAVGPSFVQSLQRPQDGRTTDRDSPDCGTVLPRQCARAQT